MSTPNIPTQSNLARTLATTLGTNIEALQKQFGESDGLINFLKLKKSDVYKERIAGGLGYGNCENAFLIDNGDGKIGDGDLFLHADGFYTVGGDYAFRYQNIGRKVRGLGNWSRGGYDSRLDPRLPIAAAHISGAIRFKIGQPFSSDIVTADLKTVCK